MKKKLLRISQLIVPLVLLLGTRTWVLAQWPSIGRSPFTSELQKKQRANSGILRDSSGFQNIDLRELLAVIIQAFLSLLAMIFLALIVYGGYIWMMARGNEEEVRRAKGIIRHSIIGLVVVLSSYAIGYFVLYYLSTSGLGPGAPT